MCRQRETISALSIWPLFPVSACKFPLEQVDGTTLPANARFTGPDEARVPTTLVVAVTLAAKPQTIVALWGGFDAWAWIESPASLSVLF